MSDSPNDSPFAKSAPAKPAWAEYLTTLRIRHGLTGREAATRMGVTQQTWTGIEAGTRTRHGRKIAVTPKDETLQRVARALGLTPNERRHLFALVTTNATTQQPWQTRLKFARVAASVSHAQAAAAAGVTVTTYREWERKNSRVPRHESLRKLLTHLGWTPEQVEEFMAAVPADVAPARAPKQPTNPVPDIPQWSKFITAKRLERGLYLSHVDALVGQQSVVRRYELGGWRRSDGRLSVPSHARLDRIADALTMTPDDRTKLHFLADHQRLAVAAHGPLPLLCELLHEARKAVDVTRKIADQTVGLTPGTWGKIETGCPATVSSLTIPTVERIITRLPVAALIATALREAVPNLSQRADIEDVDGDVSNLAIA